MVDVLKCTPAVFAVGDEYQIMVPVTTDVTMWVKVGDECYYDDCNGALRSAVSVHKMTVPQEELNAAGKYTVCYRRIYGRRAYYTSRERQVHEVDFKFRAPKNEKIVAYHISDTHDTVEAPIRALRYFESQYGKIDLLILNGDIMTMSVSAGVFDLMYDLFERATGGEVPIIYARGNHDTRGAFAERVMDYTPSGINSASYYTVKYGNIWALVLDTGEDKDDDHIEYTDTAAFRGFRKRETKFIEKVIADKEYESKDIRHKLLISHTPFTMQHPAPFNIEEDRYKYWASLIKENIKPELMMCGHTHTLEYCPVGGEKDNFGQPCPMIIGSKPDKENDYFAAVGYIFTDEGIEAVFNDHEKVLETFKI